MWEQGPGHFTEFSYTKVRIFSFSGSLLHYPVAVDPHSSPLYLMQHTSLIDKFLLQMECVRQSGRPGWKAHMWDSAAEGWVLWRSRVLLSTGLVCITRWLLATHLDLTTIIAIITNSAAPCARRYTPQGVRGQRGLNVEALREAVVLHLNNVTLKGVLSSARRASRTCAFPLLQRKLEFSSSG